MNNKYLRHFGYFLLLLLICLPTKHLKCQVVQGAEGDFALITVETIYSSDNFENDSVIVGLNYDIVNLENLMCSFIQSDSVFFEFLGFLPKYYFDFSSQINFYSNEKNRTVKIDNVVLRRFRYGEPDISVTKKVTTYNENSTNETTRIISIKIFRNIVLNYIIHHTDKDYVGCNKVMLVNKYLYISKKEKESIVRIPVLK